MIFCKILQICRADDEREAILVDILGENDVFGWLGFLNGLQEMQHVAYTEVVYVALDLETILRAVDDAPKPTEGSEETKEVGSGGNTARGQGGKNAAGQEHSASMRTFDEVLFFKVLALILSEKFQYLQQEMVRSCNRLIQTDEQESLKEEIQKQQLRLLCIRKFDLPDTDQCWFVGNAVKVWMTAGFDDMGHQSTMTSHGGRIIHGHFRCRMIFLSSCVVLEPTLDGTILDASDLNHVIDATRIVQVRPVCAPSRSSLFLWADMRALVELPCVCVCVCVGCS